MEIKHDRLKLIEDMLNKNPDDTFLNYAVALEYKKYGFTAVGERAPLLPCRSLHWELLPLQAISPQVCPYLTRN